MKATTEISMQGKEVSSERSRERERERERIVEEEEYGLGGESLMTHLKSGLLKMSTAL